MRSINWLKLDASRLLNDASAGLQYFVKPLKYKINQWVSIIARYTLIINELTKRWLSLFRHTTDKARSGQGKHSTSIVKGEICSESNKIMKQYKNTVLSVLLCVVWMLFLTYIYVNKRSLGPVTTILAVLQNTSSDAVPAQEWGAHNVKYAQHWTKKL